MRPHSHPEAVKEVRHRAVLNAADDNVDDRGCFNFCIDFHFSSLSVSKISIRYVRKRTFQTIFIIFASYGLQFVL